MTVIATIKHIRPKVVENLCSTIGQSIRFNSWNVLPSADTGGL